MSIKVVLLFILPFTFVFSEERESSFESVTPVSTQEINCPPQIILAKEIIEFEKQFQKVIDKYNLLGICQTYKSSLKAGVPKDALKQAMSFYVNNFESIKNKKSLSLGDFSQNSSQKRYYLIDMTTGSVEKYRVSHGSGKVNGVSYGDKDHDGMIDQCKFTDKQLAKVNKNRKSSSIHDRWAMTRPGFFTTAYEANSTSHDPLVKTRGAWPMFSTKPRRNKLLLNGLSPGVNDKALQQGVVMHEAWYNTNDARMGRSFGCPAFQPHVGRKISKKIKGGSLYYSYVPKCADDMDIVTKQVPNWESFCN